MKYKVQLKKIWETEDLANPEEPVPLTGIQYNVTGAGEVHSIFAPGHNLNKGQVKKAIKDHIKTLPVRPELEGTTLEVDTEEAD